MCVLSWTLAPVDLEGMGTVLRPPRVIARGTWKKGVHGTSSKASPAAFSVQRIFSLKCERVNV